MSALGVIFVTLLIYQIVLLGIGFAFRKSGTSTAGFFIGGHGLGPWVASLSYAAGSSSAWSILGVSGIAFSQGLSAIWLLPGTLAGHLVVWFFLAPRLQAGARSQGWITLTDVITRHLPDGVARLTARLSAVVILFSFLFYVAAQFQGAANTFTTLLDLDFLAALLIGAAVVLVYTLWGGFLAVSVTDALQAGLMLVAAVVLPVAAVIEVGGFSALAQAYADANWLGARGGWFAIGFFLGMVSIGFGPLGQPHLLNRIMALKSADAIRLARGVALAWFVIVLSGMFVLGLVANVLLSGQAVDGNPESVFFTMAEDLLPPVLTGVLIAAVLSAIMSTADSQLLVAGAALNRDLGLGTGPLAARLAVVVVGLGAVAVAATLPESIFARVLFAWNALGAAFGPVLIVSLLSWRVRPMSVPIAIAIGFLGTAVLYSLPNGPGDVWERAIPFLTAFVTLWLARSSRG